MTLTQVSSLSAKTSSPTTTLKLDSESNAGKGIAKLVLSIVKLLTDVLERQALRRFDSGTLSTSQIEELGTAFLQINTRIEEIASMFGINSVSELQLDLKSTRADNPSDNNISLTKPESSLAELVDLIVNRGAIVAGNVAISIANVDLIVLNLLASISPVKGEELPQAGAYCND
jgi:hypothetical protein